MKTFDVKGNLGEFTINLPESLEEITPEYLTKCTEFVHPAPNYALVAVVYKDSLSLVLTSAKKNKPANVSVVPVFIKAGECEDGFIKSLELGNRVVVAASDLSLGHHINSPYNKITPANIINLCDGDKEIYSKAILMQSPVCFVEFKLVPINVIHASLDVTKNSFINPFIIKADSSTPQA